jgi:hypothetical protein
MKVVILAKNDKIRGVLHLAGEVACVDDDYPPEKIRREIPPLDAEEKRPCLSAS